MSGNDAVIESDLINGKLKEFYEERLNSSDVKISVESGSKHGDNFMGIVYRVSGEANKPCSGKATLNNRNDSTKLSIFVKTAPSNAMRREMFFSRPSFLREIYFYNDILQSYRELQEGNGVIPEENGFHEYPELYLALTDECHEMLFLEDLKEKHFEMIDHRTEPINFDLARLALTAIGKLHALSFALREKNPEKFAKFIKDIPEVIFHNQSSAAFKERFNSLKTTIFGLLKDDETDLRQRLEIAFGESLLDAMHQLVNGASARPYAVICHGDFWTNNILFRFNKVIPVGGIKRSTQDLQFNSRIAIQ